MAMHRWTTNVLVGAENKWFDVSIVFNTKLHAKDVS
jgi:hypothetical protein